MGSIRFASCLRKVGKSKTGSFLSWFVFGFADESFTVCSGKTLKSEVNVFGFFSYILVPSVETFSHFKTAILLVL